MIALILMISGLISGLYGQNHETEEKDIHSAELHDEGHKKHVISASINHTIVFSAVKDGINLNVMLPSFGLNYTYFINHQWGIGLHHDIILEEFVVKESSSRNSNETEEVGVIERGTPVSSAIIVMYKPVPFLGLMAGAGREFSKHEDFTVIRFGIESPYHLPNNWEIFGTAAYDINIGAYENLTYGIDIGKAF